MNKLAVLEENLKSMKSVAVAFSGGVDSAFLAYVAKYVLKDKAVAVMAISPLLSKREISEAVDLAKEIGINFVKLDADELTLIEFVRNDEKRCYFCKQHRFDLLCDWARSNGIEYVIEGSNADDLKDYRPGMLAILEEDMVKSPLQEAGFTKDEIRFIANNFDISAWNKPSSSCLAARVAYRVPITKEVLRKIDEAEEFIKCFLPAKTSVRVRFHGDIARIEVSKEQIDMVFEKADLIKDKLKSLGFLYVTLDLEGFSSGSMNKIFLN